MCREWSKNNSSAQYGRTGIRMSGFLSLMTVFFGIGAVTFGGGYGMMPILQKEIVEKRGWLTSEELLDYYALGQCTPGIIAINVATLVGYKRGGTGGALAATLGFVLPALIVIILVASALQEIAHMAIVIHAFTGIRLAVCALIFHTVSMLRKTAVTDIYGLFFFAVFFLISAVFEVSPLLVVISAIVLGIVLRRETKNEKEIKDERGEPDD